MNKRIVILAYALFQGILLACLVIVPFTNGLYKEYAPSWEKGKHLTAQSQVAVQSIPSRHCHPYIANGDTQAIVEVKGHVLYTADMPNGAKVFGDAVFGTGNVKALLFCNPE